MVWTGFLANSYVDIEVNEHADGTAFFVIESLFTGVFLAELIIRMIYFASIRFWHDLWLCFDLVVIGTLHCTRGIQCPAVEIWILRPLGWNEGTFTITVMNIFRVFRVGRGVAALANIKWFRPMYLAAVGFKHSMNSLMVVTFTVAVVLCHLLGPSNPKFSDLPELVRGRFRSVERSVLSVIECLLGGIEWGPDLVDLLLFNQEWSMWGEVGRMVLLTFLVLGSLLWLNTVSGIFMQQVDRSFELTNMTQFGDKDLSWREISLVVTHHMEVLSDLGIRMPEAKRIFGELNMNSAGYVSIPMFLNRVQDNMRYKTVETLIFENQQYRLLHLMGKLAKLDKKSSKKVTDQLRLMSASMEEVQSHEPMQQAVQRRLARQRQRVAWLTRTMMNDELSKTSVSAPHLPSHQAVTALSGRGLMLECWKRSVQRQRLDIRIQQRQEAAGSGGMPNSSEAGQASSAAASSPSPSSPSTVPKLPKVAPETARKVSNDSAESADKGSPKLQPADLVTQATESGGASSRITATQVQVRPRVSGSSTQTLLPPKD
eukprot:g818.t1